MSAASVGDLLGRVRGGDAAAAEELVRTYEPELRRAIRVRLTDARLRRLVDSIDICQSVLAGFFVRTAAGQYDIQTPEDLLKLLVTMARNRVIDWARRSRADRRDGRRDVSIEQDDGEQMQFASPQPGPVSVLVSRELLEQVRSRLAPEELKLMEQRAEGLDWNQIAAQTGDQANAVRMRLTRALDRVAEELGLEQSHV
jgi:RNA polymerase sigma-70 factor (ECF subfamily)